MRTSRNNPSPAPRRQSGRTPTGAAGLAAERARSSVMAFVPETIDERAASESAIAMLLGQAELLVPGPDGRPRSLESEAAHAARSLRTLSAPLPEGRQREFEAFCLREAEMRGRGQGVPSASWAAKSAWFFFLLADRRYREIFRDDARANERIRQVHELYERISAKATRAHAAGRRATLPEAELRLIYAVDSIAITAPTRE